jgi:hypothetical protein
LLGWTTQFQSRQCISLSSTLLGPAAEYIQFPIQWEDRNFFMKNAGEEWSCLKKLLLVARLSVTERCL